MIEDFNQLQRDSCLKKILRLRRELIFNCRLRGIFADLVESEIRQKPLQDNEVLAKATAYLDYLTDLDNRTRAELYYETEFLKTLTK